MNMNAISESMIAARPQFVALSPKPANLFTGRAARVVKYGFLALATAKTSRDLISKGKPASHVVGDFAGGRILAKITKPIKASIRSTTHPKAHLRAPKS